MNLLHFGHCPYLGADITVVQTLNISRQTFCVTGYEKDSRTKTFCVSEHWTNHRTDYRIVQILCWGEFKVDSSSGLGQLWITRSPLCPLLSVLAWQQLLRGLGSPQR